MRLGIDFGTTRTVVAVADDGRYPLVTFDVSGGYVDHVPGLAVEGSRGLLFGWDARAELAGGGAAIRSIKRRVGAGFPDDDLQELDVSALELTTAFLTHLREMIVERGNLDIEAGEDLEAMVAVPANSSSHQRYLTLEAFRRAGFVVVGMMSEPTAAAIEYAFRNKNVLRARSPKRYVVVYDLGGGTFDTSAISLAHGRFELITTEGIPRLGGDDFDEVLLGLALEEAGIDPGSLGPAARVGWLEACREAKEALGPRSRRLLVDPCTLPDLEPVVVDATALYAACQPLVDLTLVELDRVFARLPGYGIDPDDHKMLGAVYVVGGGAAFPSVHKTLRARFERKVKLAPIPYAATAIGLAVAADPEAGILVRESVTRHFGVWREGHDGVDKVFDPILRKDTPSPEGVVLRRRYRPAHRVGHLRFLECSRLDERGQPEGVLTGLAEVHFPYDPALLEEDDLCATAAARTDELADQEIVETYTYGSDGCLSLEIENRTRGYRRTYALGE